MSEDNEYTVLMKKIMFTPIKIAVKNQVKKFQKIVRGEAVQPISLEQIITTQIDEPE